MSNSYTLAATETLAALIAPFDLVMHRKVGDDEHVVMVSDRVAYAVCRVFPARQICTSPNFHVPDSNGLLNAPLSAEGLGELLHWIDRKTALARFSSLLREDAPGLSLLTGSAA
jgi:hypothetical protein